MVPRDQQRITCGERRELGVVGGEVVCGGDAVSRCCGVTCVDGLVNAALGYTKFL